MSECLGCHRPTAGDMCAKCEREFDRPGVVRTNTEVVPSIARLQADLAAAREDLQRIRKERADLRSDRADLRRRAEAAEKRAEEAEAGASQGRKEWVQLKRSYDDVLAKMEDYRWRLDVSEAGAAALRVALAEATDELSAQFGGPQDQDEMEAVFLERLRAAPSSDAGKALMERLAKAEKIANQVENAASEAELFWKNESEMNLARFVAASERLATAEREREAFGAEMREAAQNIRALRAQVETLTKELDLARQTVEHREGLLRRIRATGADYGYALDHEVFTALRLATPEGQVKP
jgi:chromosome segregation ATPase